MGAFTGFELKILDLIQQMRSPGLDEFMVTITNLGNGAILWIGFIIIFLSTREYKTMGKLMAIAFLVNLLVVNIALKNIVDRTRPYDVVNFQNLLIPPIKNGSFPSGHSSYAFTAATIIIAMSRSKVIKIYTSILAILIAFSRLYLYVHFPSDVIIGSLLGILIATYTMKIYYSDEYQQIRTRYLKKKK